MVKALKRILMAVVVVLCHKGCHGQAPVGNSKLDEPLEKPVTLYDDNDLVVELFDDTVSQIYGSEFVWVVEFYAHW